MRRKRLRLLLFFALLGITSWGQACTRPQATVGPARVQAPRIDLRAVDQAFWATRGSNPRDFQGWMKSFEDEVNAIYFATLRRLNPQADPTTLMSEPVRVDAQSHGGLLHLYGYIDDNGRQGFQDGQDVLLFVLEQTRPYAAGSRTLYYSLRDADGYYYRAPHTAHQFSALNNGSAVGFFLYPRIWFAPYWRARFGWWSGRYTSAGPWYASHVRYYSAYPRFRRYYRRTYYVRSRPWGWRRGRFYRRGPRGRYYRRRWRRYRRYRYRRYRRYRRSRRYRRYRRYRHSRRYRRGRRRYRRGRRRYRRSRRSRRYRRRGNRRRSRSRGSRSRGSRKGKGSKGRNR